MVYSLSLKLPLVIESDSYALLARNLLERDTVSFQIPIGLDENSSANGIDSRPIDVRVIPEGRLCVGQLKGRNLPVASRKAPLHLKQCLYPRCLKAIALRVEFRSSRKSSYEQESD
jgi:hypothetical protein